MTDVFTTVSKMDMLGLRSKGCWDLMVLNKMLGNEISTSTRVYKAFDGSTKRRKTR